MVSVTDGGGASRAQWERWGRIRRKWKPWTREIEKDINEVEMTKHGCERCGLGGRNV